MSENHQNNKPDLRWIKRLDNFKKAFKQLELGVEQATDRDLSDLEKEGLIQRFEYNQALSWLTIQDFYKYLGETSIQGSMDAFKLAINRGLVSADEGDILMKSIKSKNKTIHIYHQDTAEEIFNDIINIYYQAFSSLKTALEKQQQQRNL